MVFDVNMMLPIIAEGIPPYVLNFTCNTGSPSHTIILLMIIQSYDTEKSDSWSLHL